MAKAFVAPFVLYLLGTAVLSSWPEYYPLGYPAVVLIVGMATFRLLKGRSIVAPHGRVAAGVLVGVVGIAVWIGLCELRLEEGLAPFLPAWLRSEPRVGFNPDQEISHPLVYWGFLGGRLLGLVVLVPPGRGTLLAGVSGEMAQISELGADPPRSVFGLIVRVGGSSIYPGPPRMVCGSGLLLAAQSALDVEARSLELHRGPRGKQPASGDLHS